MTKQVSSNSSLGTFPEFIRPTIKAVFGDKIPPLQMPLLASDASADEMNHASLIATQSLLQDTIKSKMDTLPPGEVSILKAKHGLAITHRELGQEKDAEEEYLRLIEYSEKYHGPHFRAIWAAIFNLSRIYKNTDRQEQAELMLKELVPLLQNDSRVGKESPPAICAVRNLVEVLKAQGKNEEAMKYVHVAVA